MKRALLIIDLQNDFLPGGTLAVPQGDAIIAPIRQLIISDHFDLKIATQDWHPAGHSSFLSSGTPGALWPDHCIQETPGAAFAPGINPAAFDAIIQKGTTPEVDSYSGFFDNQKLKQTELHATLQHHNVEHLTIAGLATDYCVKFTVLDALDLGYDVTLVTDACRGVGIQKGDIESALQEMATAGAELIPLSKISLN